MVDHQLQGTTKNEEDKQTRREWTGWDCQEMSGEMHSKVENRTIRMKMLTRNRTEEQKLPSRVVSEERGSVSNGNRIGIGIGIGKGIDVMLTIKVRSKNRTVEQRVVKMQVFAQGFSI